MYNHAFTGKNDFLCHFTPKITQSHLFSLIFHDLISCFNFNQKKNGVFLVFFLYFWFLYVDCAT